MRLLFFATVTFRAKRSNQEIVHAVPGPQEVQPLGPVNASRSKNKKGKTFPKPTKRPNTPTLTTDKRAEADGSQTRRPIEDWPLADISSIIAAKFITVMCVSGSGMDGGDIFLTSPAGWVVMDG